MIKMYKYKINEIFYSIQGEGFNVGRPAVFIRFYGCNLKCPFCDTPNLTFNEMTVDEIEERIKQIVPDNKYPMIVLTGGEPLLQLNNNHTLIDKLSNYVIAIETNGTIVPNFEGLNWITVSPKVNSICKIKKANELKLLVNNEGIMHCKNPGECKADYYYLQPCMIKCNNYMRTLRRCLDYIYGFENDLFYNNIEWRLSCQIQKFLKLR
jgi:organic radical activating enzyme